MSVAATIRVFCEANPSLGTAAVNGLLAWAATLGGCMVFCSGLPAAVAVFYAAGCTVIVIRHFDEVMRP
jgi:hypothetical protein